MKIKIDKNKRIKILKTQLWKIKRENEAYKDTLWFEVFINSFGKECGLQKTSIRGESRSRNWKWVGKGQDLVTYYFKIMDTNKYMLAKIKYGI